METDEVIFLRCDTPTLVGRVFTQGAIHESLEKLKGASLCGVVRSDRDLESEPTPGTLKSLTPTRCDFTITDLRLDPETGVVSGKVRHLIPSFEKLNFRYSLITHIVGDHARPLKARVLGGLAVHVDTPNTN